MEEKLKSALPHNVVLEDRRVLRVSGVCDVDSFDEQTVIAFTNMGEMTVRGEDIHISRLNVDTGELELEGNFYALTYTDSPKQSGFFSKLFR